MSQVIYGRRESPAKQQLTANGRRGLPNCKGACLEWNGQKRWRYVEPVTGAAEGPKNKEGSEKNWFVGRFTRRRLRCQGPSRGNRATPPSPANGVGRRQNAQRSFPLGRLPPWRGAAAATRRTHVEIRAAQRLRDTQGASVALPTSRCSGLAPMEKKEGGPHAPKRPCVRTGASNFSRAAERSWGCGKSETVEDGREQSRGKVIENSPVAGRLPKDRGENPTKSPANWHLYQGLGGTQCPRNLVQSWRA